MYVSVPESQKHDTPWYTVCVVLYLLYVIFLSQSQRFRLYEAYCKNRSNSNALIADDTACNAFFKVSIKCAYNLCVCACVCGMFA